MNIDGSCHCKNITYKAKVDSEKVVICHCDDCQKLSGTAFRTIVFCQESDFTLLSGEPKIYLKTSESGNKREQAFCAECGSPIYATSIDSGPRVLGLRLGSVEQRAEFVPKKQIWFQSSLRWLENLSAILKVEKQ